MLLGLATSNEMLYFISDIPKVSNLTLYSVKN